MKKRQIFVGSILLFALVLLSYSVFAQNLLAQALGPLAGMDVGATYNTYWYVIDCIMYMMILIGAAQFSLGQRFQGSGGKAIVIGVGISLAIAAAVFEKTYTFKLIERLGPLSIIIIVLFFVFAVYRMFTALGGESKYYGMLGFAIMFFYINAQFPEINRWVTSFGNSWLGATWGLLNFAAVIFLGWGLWGLISMFREGGAAAGPGAGGGNAPAVPRTPGTPRTPAAPTTPNPAIPKPRDPVAYEADNTAIIKWISPGGNIDGFVVTRYRRKKVGSNKLVADQEIPITNPAQTVCSDIPSNGDYIYGVQSTQGGNRSEIEYARNLTPGGSRRGNDQWLQLNDSHFSGINVGFMGMGGAGGASIMAAMTFVGTRVNAAGISLVIYGISPANDNVLMRNINITPGTWMRWPARNPTELTGTAEIPEVMWQGMGIVPGGPAMVLPLLYNSQNMNMVR